MSVEQPNKDKKQNDSGVKNIQETKYTLGKNYYTVSVIWKNGKEVEMHFPTDGFPVVNPETREELGYLTGEQAVEILRKHASEYNQGDFFWKNFLNTKTDE